MPNLEFLKNPDLLVISGSRLYGYANKDSDLDQLGFVIPPFEVELSMINNFNQKSPNQEDIENGDDCKIYSLRKFFKNLISNDTQCLEILFAPPENIQLCSAVGRRVIDNRDLFLSKSLYKRFAGYASSEFRKVKGVAIVPQKQAPDEKKILDQMINIFRPEKNDIAKIKEILFQKRPVKEVNVFRKLGAKRKESIKKYGYSIKNAAQCIRLLMEGIQLFNTNTLTFPLVDENIKIIKKIRNGESTIEEVEELFKYYDFQLKEAADNSSLPSKIKEKKVDDLFLELTMESFKK